MIYSLLFLPEVEKDVISGFDWYEDNSSGLGEEFLRLFYAYANEIPRNPLLFPVVYKSFRRRLLRRFPYAIYFRIEEQVVVVFGLFHCARNPNFIEDSLNGRTVEQA
jgi:hypothetical protein